MIKLEKVRIDLGGFSIRDVDLSVGKGEFFALLGPTGAGKTLLLEAIGGLVPVTSGRIVIEGTDVTNLPPEKRGVGIVYQDCALFPHMTVLQNIAYGLRYKGVERSTLEGNLAWLIERLDIAPLLERSIGNLSGGEKQRVALTRALAVKPSLLLLDEPLSALDANFRTQIRQLLKILHQQLGTTFVLVTHDFADTFSLAERAAVINRGRIEQIGTSAEVFQRPASPLVAEFVGMKNVFPASFHGSKALLGDVEIEVGEAVPGSRSYVGVRPEDVVIAPQRLAGDGFTSLRGEIVSVADAGPYYEVAARVGGVIFHSVMAKSAVVEMQLIEGSQIYVGLNPSRIHTF